jgi:prepilin-type N-terminal cleavage/methylation domain-containing protein
MRRRFWYEQEKTRNINGFTLIELLVVIAVIALLLAIVVPVLRKVKAQARKAVCSSQLHQWGVALIAYGGDHNSRLPKTPGTNIGSYGRAWWWWTAKMLILSPIMPGGFQPLFHRQLCGRV